jgi:hypothetical protein
VSQVEPPQFGKDVQRIAADPAVNQELAVVAVGDVETKSMMHWTYSAPAAAFTTGFAQCLGDIRSVH